LREKREGLLTVTETAVVETDELREMIAAGQERGFLTPEAIAAALEETELSREQVQELFGYLDEHGIEVVGRARRRPIVTRMTPYTGRIRWRTVARTTCPRAPGRTMRRTRRIRRRDCARALRS
jgi:hypothetical protein